MEITFTPSVRAILEQRKDKEQIHLGHSTAAGRKRKSGACLPTAVFEATKNRFCSGQQEKEPGAGLPTAVLEAIKNRFWQRTFQQRPEDRVHKIPKAPKQCR